MVQSVLAGAQLAHCTSRIDIEYQKLEIARQQGGPEAATRIVAPGERFVPTASSLTLGAILSHEDRRILLAEIGAASAGAWIRGELGSRLACDLDQAWVRRQYAPWRYPPLHAPHGWHQDGGLGFDFPSHRGGTFPSDALLPMVTCWITLGPCGTYAPGLEFVARRLDRLLAPTELTDESVREHFGPEEFWRPAMESGDALLFRGDVLHRTHVTPAMTNNRTSIEVRFFMADNIPARLQDDRFLLMD